MSELKTVEAWATTRTKDGKRVLETPFCAINHDYVVAHSEWEWEPLVLRSDAEELQADARRYNAFFDAGLPITFMGVEYHDKKSLDEAIDAQTGKEIE